MSTTVEVPEPPRTNPPRYTNVITRLAKGDGNDYLGLSIFNLVCCFFCFGIPALIFSIKARELYRNGLAAEAEDAAKIAKKLNIAGIVIGIILIIFTVIFLVIYFFIIMAVVAASSIAPNIHT